MMGMYRPEGATESEFDANNVYNGGGGGQDALQMALRKMMGG